MGSVYSIFFDYYDENKFFIKNVIDENEYYEKNFNNDYNLNFKKNDEIIDIDDYDNYNK